MKIRKKNFKKIFFLKTQIVDDDKLYDTLFKNNFPIPSMMKRNYSSNRRKMSAISLV